jgi:hypothetical protein
MRCGEGGCHAIPRPVRVALSRFRPSGRTGHASRQLPITNRSWVGRYQLHGDRIKILWQDYPNDLSVITLNAHSATRGLDVYEPMCRCTGKRFSGTYNWGVTGSGQYLQFSADGTSVDHQVLDQLFVPNAFYEHPRTQNGTYAIQDQTMIFTFADVHRDLRWFFRQQMPVSV